MYLSQPADITLEKLRINLLNLPCFYGRIGRHANYYR